MEIFEELPIMKRLINLRKMRPPKPEDGYGEKGRFAYYRKYFPDYVRDVWEVYEVVAKECRENGHSEETDYIKDEISILLGL